MDDSTGSNPRGRKPKRADDPTSSTPRGRKPKGADDATGSSPRTPAAAGVTAATGSRARRMIRKPMVAFQKPMTYQGNVTANSTTNARSSAPKPPGESAITASQTMPAIENPTSVENNSRRASRAGGLAVATWSLAVRSSMAFFSDV
jgi:hypothetical protein